MNEPLTEPMTEPQIDMPTGLVLMIDEEAANKADWQSDAFSQKPENVVATAYALVAAEFGTDAEVAVMLTSDAHIQKLNDDFRNKDKATNVLSFPDADEARLGDIAIAYGTIFSEAHQANLDLGHHLSHMVIHGMLHLLGYDHETDEEAEEMEALEIDLLARLNIENPYLVSN
ncbi:MAG: rRNA maturation RNase YbeY [Alphaproteobacteria bacterium]